MIREILKKPYPFAFSKFSYLVPAIITFLLILFFSPFGFSKVPFALRSLFSITIAVIVGASIYGGVRILQRYAPTTLKEERWTIGKEFGLMFFILMIIVCVITVVVFCLILYQNDLSNTSYIVVLWKTFSKTAMLTMGICIVPIGISVLVEQRAYHKKRFQQAQQLSKVLQNQLSDIQSSEQKQNIQFMSDKNEIELQVHKDDVLLVKSDGNYVEVHYVSHKGVNKKLIRNRIKNIEDLLSESPFFRCHNRYIINGNFITKIDGNARGLVLELKDTDDTIPVSRSKIKSFESFISSL